MHTIYIYRARSRLARPRMMTTSDDDHDDDDDGDDNNDGGDDDGDAVVASRKESEANRHFLTRVHKTVLDARALTHEQARVWE